MKFPNLILVTILAILLLSMAACTSTVRFNHNTSNNKTAQKNSSSPSKSTNPKERITEIEQLRFSNSQLSGLSSIRRNILDEAEKWLGVPYRYGGNTHSGVDCSGLVVAIYSSIGYRLPRTSRDQYNYAQNIEKDELLPGDLLFFQQRGRINHVGIYIGNGEMIHSASSQGVIIQSIYDSYYIKNYAGSGRIIKI